MSIFFVLYFVIPALVLVSILHPDEDASPWDLAAGLGLAMIAVGWLGFTLCLITGAPYSHTTLALTNAPFAVALLWRRRSVARQVRGWIRWSRPGLEAALTILVIAAAFAAALLLFKTDQYSNTCLHQSLAYALGLPVENQLMDGSMREGADTLLTITNREREGTFSLIAPFAMLWGFFGLRLIFACTVALNGVFGLLIARRWLGGSLPASLLLALLFSSFPFGADILWNDTNTVAFFSAAALLYVASCRPRHVWLLGALFAALVSVRHIAIVSALGPLLLGLRGRGPRWPGHALGYGAALLLVLLPLLVHHAVAFGSPFSYESFAEYSRYPHQLLGVRFELNGMLNFPFHSELVRTPFNLLPVMFLFPLWLTSRMGVVLAALGLVGAAAHVSRAWRGMLPVMLFVAPYLLILAVNENWMQIEKMGAIAPVMPVLLLACALGATVIERLDGWWRRGRCWPGPCSSSTPG